METYQEDLRTLRQRINELKADLAEYRAQGWGQTL